jgi:sugar phosphate isomerase/epimerase
MTPSNPLAVFVKPWKSLTLVELAAHVRRLGFEWIELPVRPGFPCQPQTIESDLPKAVEILGAEGVRILNVTVDSPLDDERIYAACAAAGVTLNRVMFRCRNRNYWDAEADARRALDSAVTLCERYNVRIGIQNHVGDFVGVHEFGLHHLLQGYDPNYFGAIWDAAHNALEGMAPELALDVIADRLFIVNLKNAFRQRITGPEAEVAEWKVYWTSGRQGQANWPRVAAKLRQINYAGPICLTAEYSDESSVDRLVVEDLTFAREVLQQ